MFGARATFLNRDTESVVALAPNIELGFGLSAMGSGKISNPEPNAQSLIFGGADRDRTGGLLVANQALSQLSYSP